MRLDQNISELLFKYDCVIVPDLGGFVTNYSPASLDENSNIFSPPSKSLSFNSYLKNNDGLLAKYISEKEELSFEDVNIEIKKEVEDYFSKLNSGKRVVFDKVGILYMDKAKNIQFSPDESLNYLLDSFGLRSVFAHPQQQSATRKIERLIPVKPVVKEKVKTREEVKVIALPTIDKAEVELENDPALRRRIWRVAAVIIPLTIFAGYFVTEPEMSTNSYLSNLNPFKDSVIQQYENRIIEFDIPQVSMESDFPDLFELPGNQESFLYSLIEEDVTGIPVHVKKREIPVKVEVNTVSTAVAESTYFAPKSISQLRYHIVAGCFGERINANKQVAKLRKRGYNAFIVDKRKGLHRVVYGSFATRNDALILLQEVKQNEDRKAWLMKK